MAHYLARAEHQVRKDWMHRFDAAQWTVNFPRPMLAAATVPVPGTVRVDLSFLKANDLAGLIWESEDKEDHPLLRYETRRDYRGLLMRFRWRAEGAVRALDAPNGPVLTIEGRDESGAPKIWYVRLWNYAVGTPTDAAITLDFGALDGGYALPGEADRVWAGDIDRLFISLAPQSYSGADTALHEAEEAVVWLEDIRCEGPGASIRSGDAFLPPHELRMAAGYDDQYNLTPARLMRNMRALGYRDWLTIYAGMSHFMRLRADDGGRFVADPNGDVLAGPARVWFEDLARLCAAEGVTPIWSLSYELFNAYAPEDWKQRAHDGSPALTGWEPPSTLLSPLKSEAMTWLQKAAGALVALSANAGLEPRFQVGEPWWWTGFGTQQLPCFYDAAATAAYEAETGNEVPPPLTGLPASLSHEQEEYADWLGAKLGRSVLDLAAAARSAAPGCRTALLFYAPQVLREDAPWLSRVNMPAAWARPAFDVLQLEDYDFVLAGDAGASRRAAATVQAELGYPAEEQDYFSGFVLHSSGLAEWNRIAAAAEDAHARGVRQSFVWALPQVLRDGFTYFDLGGEYTVQAFHDVRFPLEVGNGAGGGPEFLTQVAETVSGSEQRASMWAQGRLRYDAGLGVRSEADLALVQRFFRARKGQAHAFRFCDPLDHGSADEDMAGPYDQHLGTADGIQTDFPLVKRYGEGEDAEVRRITRPRRNSVQVAVNGSRVSDGWTVEPGGILRFDTAPEAGPLCGRPAGHFAERMARGRAAVRAAG